MILRHLSCIFLLPRFAVLAVVALLLCSCASGGSDNAAGDDWSSEDEWASDDDWGSEDDDIWGDIEDEDDGDPLETPNRFIFAFNETLDVFLLKPAAETYRFLLPEAVRNSVRNFLRNLTTPVILANNVLQGDEEGVNTTLARFALNSTLGVLGLFDVAADKGYPYRDEDFGLTLGSYDIGPGAYLMLPLLGPSTTRDGIGRGVDILFDPLTYVLSREQSVARFAVTGIDTRSRHIEIIEDLQRDSVDFYARVRSLYLQNRQKLIEDRIDIRSSSSSALPEAGMQSLAAKGIQ